MCKSVAADMYEVALLMSVIIVLLLLIFIFLQRNSLQDSFSSM